VRQVERAISSQRRADACIPATMPLISMLMTKLASREEMLALLDWFQAMGVDAAVDDSSCDWLARGPKAPGTDYVWRHSEVPSTPGESAANARISPRPGTAAPPAARPRAATPLGASEAEIGARKIARQATSLEALETALREFDGCGLKATATKLCFYRGAAKADLMIVGEAPGRDEDLEGKPFVGRAGQLLDKMLSTIGLGEPDVHITNIVYWRPPGNRTPRLRKPSPAGPFSNVRSNSSNQKFWSPSEALQRRRSSAWPKALCGSGANGGTSPSASEPLRQSPRSIPPTYCERQRRNNWHGRTCCRSDRRFERNTRRNRCWTYVLSRANVAHDRQR